MRLKNFRINAFAAFLIILSLTVFIMVVGRAILIPIITSIFFSMIIYPFCRFNEKYLKNRPLAILTALLVIILMISAGVWLISKPLYPFFSDISKLQDLIPSMINQAIAWLAKTFQLEAATAQNWVARLGSGFFNYLVGSIPNFSILFTTIGLLPIYSFLFLLYRSSIKQFILIQVNETKRTSLNRLIRQIIKIAQGYIYGLGLVVIILAILNALGLWIIGLPYPYFWGIIAAILAIIPYIGTFIGGLLPTLYALIYTGTIWQPIAVVILYLTVQQLEGNLITPKVVGSSVKINPLVSIIALFFFGAIWGLAGLILALPMVGIIRLFFSHIEPLRPFAKLLGNQLYQNEDTFIEAFNHPRYRVLKLFSNKDD